MLHRPTTHTAATTTPLLHQPQDCENDRKSRSALAFIALTYIQPREALVTGFLNKAQSRAPLSGLESKNHLTTPPNTHTAPIHCIFTSQAFPGLGREEKTDKTVCLLQSLVGPGFYLSCLWLLQCKSCLPLKQEGPAGPWMAVSRQQPSWLQALVLP